MYSNIFFSKVFFFRELTRLKEKASIWSQSFKKEEEQTQNDCFKSFVFKQDFSLFRVVFHKPLISEVNKMLKLNINNLPLSDPFHPFQNYQSGETTAKILSFNCGFSILR